MDIAIILKCLYQTKNVENIRKDDKKKKNKFVVNLQLKKEDMKKKKKKKKCWSTSLLNTRIDNVCKRIKLGDKTYL